MSSRRDDTPDPSGAKPDDQDDLDHQSELDDRSEVPTATQGALDEASGRFASTDDDSELRGPDAIDLDFDDPDWEPDFADDADSHEAPALPSRSRKGAVSVAFLNVGMVLEEIVYGRDNSKPPAVQEAREGDDDGPIRVHLDPEEPKKSWVSLHPEAETSQTPEGSSQSERDAGGMSGDEDDG